MKRSGIRGEQRIKNPGFHFIASGLPYWPERHALIGIQPGLAAWGERLTPAVAAALPQACEIATEIIGRFAAHADSAIPRGP